MALGDGINNIAHLMITDNADTLIKVDLTNGFLKGLANFLAFVVIAAAALVVVVASAGIGAAIIGALSGVAIGTIGVGTVIAVTLTSATVGTAIFNTYAFPEDEIYLPVYQVSAEEIFSGKIPLFDVDFFNPMGNNATYKDGSTSKALQKTISSWYVILRDISLVALLSILVYIGIRILISSASSDKAKYKQMLLDWVVAICLLFVMQYIMSFSNVVVEKISDILNSINVVSNTAGKTDSNQYLALMADIDEKVSKALEKGNENGDGAFNVDEMYLKETS